MEETNQQLIVLVIPLEEMDNSELERWLEVYRENGQELPLTYLGQGG